MNPHEEAINCAKDYTSLLAERVQINDELHMCIEKMKKLLPIKVGDVLDTRHGKFTVATIDFFEPFSVQQPWPEKPRWYVRGYKHKKDGTRGMRRGVVLMVGIEQLIEEWGP